MIFYRFGHTFESPDMIPPMRAHIPPRTELQQKLRDQRWRVSPIRLRLERRALPLLSPQAKRRRGRILCYHSVGTPEWGVNDVTPTQFAEHIDLALQLGYRFVPVETIAAGIDESRDLAITFDDGLRSVLAIAPYLTSLGIPFGISVVTAWAANPGIRFMSWDELGRLREAGASIGSHSVSHANFRDLDDDERRVELVDSRDTIRKELGFTPELFAIPFGGRRDWDAACTRLAHHAGYTAILAQSEQRRPGGTLARSFVCKYDKGRQFRAVLEGRFDNWEEWF